MHIETATLKARNVKWVQCIVEDRYSSSIVPVPTSGVLYMYIINEVGLISADRLC